MFQELARACIPLLLVFLKNRILLFYYRSGHRNVVSTTLNVCVCNKLTILGFYNEPGGHKVHSTNKCLNLYSQYCLRHSQIVNRLGDAEERSNHQHTATTALEKRLWALVPVDLAARRATSEPARFNPAQDLHQGIAYPRVRHFALALGEGL